MDGNEVQTNTGLTVKAFVDWQPIETPVGSMAEAVKLFERYTVTPYCDSAYIYQGDRIVQSWADEYGRWLASCDEADDYEDGGGR